MAGGTQIDSPADVGSNAASARQEGTLVELLKQRYIGRQETHSASERTTGFQLCLPPLVVVELF